MKKQVINLKSESQVKITALQNQFDRGISMGEVVRVFSCGKEIYSKPIDLRGLVKVKACTKLHALDDKIIDLKDHKIDCSLESSNHYVVQLFDKLLFFLTTGYMEIEERFAMDLLYLGIVMDIPKLVEKSSITVNKKYYGKLWDVLVLHYNEGFDRQSTTQNTITKLMGFNYEFLVDQDNQVKFHPKFLTLESLKIASNFLRDLAYVITFNGSIDAGHKAFALIDTLYKYYMYCHKIPASQYSSNKVMALLGSKISSEVFFAIKDINIDQLFRIVEDKEKQHKVRMQRVQQEKLALREEIQDLRFKLEQVKEQEFELIQRVDTQERLTSLTGVNTLSPKTNVIHHPQLVNSCECSHAVTLPCGHNNCAQCALCKLEDYKRDSEKPIENYKYRCLQNDHVSGSCTEIWTTELYKSVGELLSQVFG